jgi:DNA-binding PadR family transcriptional regulator
MRQELFRGHLETLVLAVLAAGPRHGYAISQELTARTGGVLAYPTGSLYPALRRLEQAKLIAGTWQGGSGKQRRTYQLTAAGRRILAANTRDWRRFSEAVERVLRLSPPVTG